jgi:NTE family protein
MKDPVRHVLSALLTLALAAAPTFGQAAGPEGGAPPAPPASPTSTAPGTRPKLALVLSGGGARGAAHIGVLKVLEENHIVPDLIVGTSMGSIVGGLYAAGYSPKEIEDILATIDWGEVFFDTVKRTDRPFRRKGDDSPYLIPLKLRFIDGKPSLPGGLLGGQKLELTLRDLIVHATDETDFDKLPIPYRAVAMDLGTSQAVVLAKGDLVTAMRASMSIPGAFAPVVIDGRQLVDGGSAANLPVGIAQRLGAERIIAVNISTPLSTEVKGLSFLGVISQLTAFLTAGSVDADKERLRKVDILIEPDLKDISFKSFNRAREAVGIGEAAAREKVDVLRTLGTDERRWQEFEARHRRHDATASTVKEFHLDNSSWLDDRIVQEGLHVTPGEPLNAERLKADLIKLSAYDTFGLMSYDIQADQGESRITLHTPTKPYSRGSLQFGLNLRSDFAGDDSYALLIRHRVLAVNRLNGEWVNTFQIGGKSLAATEFYQPLDWGQRWFAVTGGALARTTQTLWSDGDPIADARIDVYEGALGGGRVLGNWGELRAELYRGKATGDIRIGPPATENETDHLGGIRATFSVDTRNRAVFSTRGAHGIVLFDQSIEAFGGETDWSQARIKWGQFLSFGRNTFTPYAFLSSNFSREATLHSAATVGGFGQLSGLGDNELIGDRGGNIGLSFYHELTGLSLGAVAGRLYAGGSLEAGNVYGLNDSITWDSLRYGGSVFLGAETPLGPAYLGYGWTEPDQDRFYFVIGDRF